jgi:N-acetylglucosaminyldiphosphoundecaprenol N-acetyl-beta-D-mannosaminyltransferase
MNRKTRRLFGVEIDVATMKQAVARIFQWVEQPAAPCRLVVTPNVDHIVMLQRHEGLRAAYRDANLVLADGWPVVLASRLLCRPLPERVPGSDLGPALFAASPELGTLRVFLLGAAPGVAAPPARVIQRTWPTVCVSDVYSPPIGFEHNEAENAKILRRIEKARPDLLLIGLGAPKQELWAHAHRDKIHASVALCIGATIDFLAGQKSRAPAWMRSCGLEWLHRVLSEPKRLAGRYARDAWNFPRLVWREWLRGLPGA